MKKSRKFGVNSKRERCIQAIAKIRQDIDSLNLSDQKAWKTLAIEVEALVQNFPNNLSVPLKTLGLCTQAIQIVTEKTKVRSFALIEGLSCALNAVETYLLNKSDKKSAIQIAAQQLKKALAEEQGGAVDNQTKETDRPAEAPTVSLDDAAALVIQLEPDDLPGLMELKELLQRIAADEAYLDDCREYVSEAAKQIEDIIQVSTDNRHTALTNAGELLEKAMNLFLEPGPEADSHRQHDAGQAVMESEDSMMAKNSLLVDEGSKPDYMPKDADPDLLVEFIAESMDLISSAEEALLSLETDPKDMDAVNTVFRAFHTIKGTAGFMELTLISEMGHYAESLLSRVREGEILYGGGYADLSLRALDMLKELILSVQGALQGHPLSRPAGYPDLMELLANPEGAGVSDEQNEERPPRLGDVLVAQGKLERNKVEQAAQSHPHEMIGAALVKDKVASVTDVGRALRTQKRLQIGGQVVESSVRVSTERLDRLIDMVGELVIAHSMMAQDDLIVNGNHHGLLKKIAHTSKIVRELQDISMSMRMIPLKATFNKMARLVRDLARKMGKKVHFVTEGEDTEIDRNLVDIINDPLVHMLRNAVDHGIETPEIRRQHGKPEYGTVALYAYHSAGNVVVEIKDDGKGLDREMIVAKAREKGLIEQSRSLNDREVFNLIFEPGFSTAKTVTDVSGRGVGMDVVKKNIESLRGLAEIRSEKGKGSVFKVILPLTLAIIDGMLVRVVGETYVIPTVSIVRCITPQPGDISTVHNRSEMFCLPESLIPLFRLDGLFCIGGDTQEQNPGLVVVVEDEEHQAGLIVDELIGRQQVVIKALGEAMRDIPGISGGAILPNGRVGLILDVAGLLRFATAGHGQRLRQQSCGAIGKVLAA
jgi:two-component system chemotaxis sensor kinase CheA